MNKIDIDELVKILPKLIRENDTVKGAIISALSDVLPTHKDIIELGESIKKQSKEMEERMEKRFQELHKQNKQMDDRMNTQFKKMDDRMNTQFKKMDDRIIGLEERMDDRIIGLEERMDERDKKIEIMDKKIDGLDEKIEFNYRDLKSVLVNIQTTIGKPFEQFGRNVIVRLLESEGYTDVQLEDKKFEDANEFLKKGSTEIEIDGFCLDPPVIVEITSILRDKEKIDLFLRKKEFVERKYDLDFRGFFVAANSELSSEDLGEISVELRKHGSELINL
jgi:gas vesicle protein